MKKIFHYHPESREFLGESEAARSPEDKEVVYLIPAHCAEVAPPVAAAGQVAVYDTMTGRWSLVSDRRGEVWFDPSKDYSEVRVSELGEPDSIVDSVPASVLLDRSAAEIRVTRNSLLASSDWRLMEDAPGTKAQRSRWLEYRCQLRQITDQQTFPESVMWPTPPAMA